MAHADGVSPAWPFPYAELEPWYCRAEAMFQVRGAAGEDPTEPPHSRPYPYPPVPDEPPIAAVRARLKRAGVHPFSLPLGVDIERWLRRGADALGRLSRHAHAARWMPRPRPCAQALRSLTMSAGDRRRGRAPA